jgi:NAD+ synthase (glutamine-hydrolysing)
VSSGDGALYAGTMARLRLALAQLNLVVGDLEGNVEQVLEAMKSAEADGCDLVAFPELAVTGYPPEDLLLKAAFVADNRRALERIVAASGRCAAIVGFVDGEGDDLYNAAAVCADGHLHGVYRKQLLPNYEVFDERRYFRAGQGPPVLYEIGGHQVAVTICEDAWSDEGPLAEAGRVGAELIVNINGSPFHAGKVGQRERTLAARAAEARCPIAYVNLVGGQDELVFDGGSLVMDAAGAVVTRAPQFAEALFVTDLAVPSRPGFGAEPGGRVEAPRVMVSAAAPAAPVVVSPAARGLSFEHEVYEALVLGTRDYVTKNGFGDVVVGLSGGIDSSLVATIAVDALGPDRVHGVLMPSRYSSDHSITDAEALAANLGIDHATIAIEPAHRAFTEMLAPSFVGRPPDLTEENLQSRLRGVTLMALSNKLGWLVLTTGNKSESAVGYSTLYGDTAGGFAVIKDVLKLLVYRLCRDRNARAGRELIPETILVKPPSAELRPDQRDDQSLPPYEVLDPIIDAYVTEDRTASELVEAGFDAATVQRVVGLIDRAEYKRRQTPPGVRLTTKAFGKDRRLPITNAYRG